MVLNKGHRQWPAYRVRDRKRLLVPGSTFSGTTARGRTEKPHGSWMPERVIEFMAAGDFYIICPDNDVTRVIDNRRTLWAAEDIIRNRPALSRWHPEYADEFAASRYSFAVPPELNPRKAVTQA